MSGSKAVIEEEWEKYGRKRCSKTGSVTSPRLCACVGDTFLRREKEEQHMWVARGPGWSSTRTPFGQT